MVEIPDGRLDEIWLALQDSLMQGAYWTIKGVIADKENGKPEPYFDLLHILNDFSKRQLRMN